MTGTGAYQRKDGRWETRIYSHNGITGKREYRAFYGLTKEEALQKRLSALAFSFDGGITEISVRDLFAEWLQVISTRVKPSTLANYRMKAEKHIIPAFGGIMCHEITTKAVYDFINAKINSGLSARYVSDIIILLKSLFKYAKRTYRISSPLDGIVVPKPAKREIRLLTAQEQEQLRLYIGMNFSLISLGVVLANGMGLRVGEVCGLKWSDIDLEKRILTVRRTVQRVAVNDGINKTKVMIMPPKSASSAREIPIPDSVFSMLQSNADTPDHYVLSGASAPVEPRKMQYHFAKMLKKAELRAVTFHSLRHRFASRAVEVGFDIKTLSEILGHSKVELTMNLYVHSSMDRKRSCMQLLG